MESNKWQSKNIKELFKAIAQIKDQKEAADFFRDLCTLEELAEMARRWQAAVLLENNQTYREVSRKTGLSTTTVTRVAYWLNHGQGGYKSILNRRSKS